MAEASVNVPNSGTTKVRTFELQVIQADGSVATVEVQAVAVLDGDGLPVIVEPTRNILFAILQTLRLMAAESGIDLPDLDEQLAEAELGA